MAIRTLHRHAHHHGWGHSAPPVLATAGDLAFAQFVDKPNWTVSSAVRCGIFQ